MREGSSIGSAAGSARPGPGQAPGPADEPAAIAPDPQPPAAGAPAAGAPPAVAPPPPPPAAGAAAPLGGLLGSSTVRLGVAGVAAVLLLGLVALSIGPGPLGRPPATAGSPASNSLNAPLQRARAHLKSAKRAATHRPPRRRAPRGGAPRDVRGRARHGGGRAASVRGQDVVSDPPAGRHSASGGHAPALNRRAPALTSRALAPGDTSVAGHTDDTNCDRPHRTHGGGQRANRKPAERIGPPPGCRRAAP